VLTQNLYWISRHYHFHLSLSYVFFHFPFKSRMHSNIQPWCNVSSLFRMISLPNMKYDHISYVLNFLVMIPIMLYEMGYNFLMITH
jgi:hypothetical protein